MKAILGNEDFNPAKDIPCLKGKVIFITGGTHLLSSRSSTALTNPTGSAGLGRESAKALAAHDPTHIYFSGRNRKAGEALIKEINAAHPDVGMTFVEVDFLSLASVKEAIQKTFKHDRLDILMCNAGIMAADAKLSNDGYEIQFATNHLGHAMVVECLLPTLLRTAKEPDSDVRVVHLSSLGYAIHPKGGILFDKLDSKSTMSGLFLARWYRYGHSKLANVLYAQELARRYPQITSLAVHPGVVFTDLYAGQPLLRRWFLRIGCWLQGIVPMEPQQGCWNQIFVAAKMKKEELVNGGFYYPVGVDYSDKLVETGKDEKLASKLWNWTARVLEKF
jgi:NAD(P)-dependent dehydrogenase (short-subunit alcohol dehydrogenase family)